MLKVTARPRSILSYSISLASHPLRRLACAVSVTVCLGMLVVWARSYHTADWFSCAVMNMRRSLTSENGATRFEVFSSAAGPVSRETFLVHFEPGPARSTPSSAKRSVYGFIADRRVYSGRSITIIETPDWFLACASAGVGLSALVPWRRVKMGPSPPRIPLPDRPKSGTTT